MLRRLDIEIGMRIEGFERLPGLFPYQENIGAAESQVLQKLLVFFGFGMRPDNHQLEIIGDAVGIFQLLKGLEEIMRSLVWHQTMHGQKVALGTQSPLSESGRIFFYRYLSPTRDENYFFPIGFFGVVNQRFTGNNRTFRNSTGDIFSQVQTSPSKPAPLLVGIVPTMKGDHYPCLWLE